MNFKINHSVDSVIELFLMCMNEEFCNVESLSKLGWEAKLTALVDDTVAKDCDIYLGDFDTIIGGYYRVFSVTIGIEEIDFDQANLFIKFGYSDDIGEDNFINIEFSNGNIKEIEISEDVFHLFKILSTKVERITRSTDIKVSVLPNCTK